ncbi:MAG: PAS domain-containing protein [Polyangiaceae bacterium]|nr:PAS domain-containing protein [Polyangiaceae bacterium]
MGEKRRSDVPEAVLIDHLPFVAWHKDEEGRFVAVNRAFADACGRASPEELVGLTDYDCWPEELAARYRSDDDAVLSTGETRLVEEPIAGQDETRFFETYKTPVRNEYGRTVGTVGFARDITVRHNAEMALRRHTEQLAQAAKLEAVGRLANGVAHDFNNVLTAILGFSEIIAMKLESEKALADLREVQAAAKRGASLTRQLLAFSRSSTELPSRVDVNDLLSNLENMLRRLLGSEVDFSLTTSEMPAIVRIPPHELERVVVNLAVNARDAMPRGGMLHVSVGRTELDERSANEIGVRPGDFVVIRVADSGVGLAPEVRVRLFEPFFTTKEAGGTGLGLATSYGIVRQADGAMVVHSKVGEGTTFEVLLPSIDEPIPAPAPDIPAPTGNRNGNILLVDDEGPIRDLAGRYLRQLGYQVRTAAHAGEALVYAEDPSVPIQLLITDLVMPDMDGMELARRLLLRRPDLRVVFLTGYFPPDAVKAAQEGGHPVLRKPFSLSDLGHEVARLVEDGVVRSRA